MEGVTLVANSLRYCLQCRKRLPASMRADAEFCSPSCRAKHHRWITAGRKRMEERSEQGSRLCPHCHRPLVRKGLDLKRTDAVYCSIRCRVAAHRARASGQALARFITG
jgi:hypothetical protein